MPCTAGIRVHCNYSGLLQFIGTTVTVLEFNMITASHEDQGPFE